MSEIPDEFNEDIYMLMNPDVEFAVKMNHYKSGLEHFMKFGHKENRIYTLNPVTDVLGGGFYSPSHFSYPYSSVGDLKTLTFSDKSQDISSDLIIVQRLAEAYRSAITNQPDDFRVDKSGMWSVNMKRIEVELIQPLIEKKFDVVADILSEIFATNLTIGLGMGKSSRFIARHAQKPFASVFADHLIKLAEAVGVIGVRNQEQGKSFTAPLDPDVDQLFRMICQKLVRTPNIERNNVGCIYGIQINNSIWHIRDLEHMQAASTVTDLVLDKDHSILEIGGGYGNLAYWLYKIGFRDITLIDLPHINIIQGYYLSKCLPEAKICMYNDVNKTEFNSAEIKIMPYWYLDSMASKSIGISINQDSLPEIPEPIALHYIKEITRVTKEFFYSANQEAGAANYTSGIQESVPRLVEKTGGLRRMFRAPFWCRPGYVQEVYVPQ